jgi:hypothetical protein
MLLKEAQPTIHKLRRREAAGLEHDPASLSAELRELAVRAHRLVRATDGSRSQPTPDAQAGVLFNLGQELIELRSEIVRLEQKLRAQNLGGLLAYVSALRQRVEENLA